MLNILIVLKEVVGFIIDTLDEGDNNTKNP